MENITLHSTSTAQSLGLRERKQQDNEVWKTYSMTIFLIFQLMHLLYTL